VCGVHWQVAAEFVYRLEVPGAFGPYPPPCEQQSDVKVTELTALRSHLLVRVCAPSILPSVSSGACSGYLCAGSTGVY
jgi:hypothetical protein